MEEIVISDPDPPKQENINPNPITIPKIDSNKNLTTEDNKQQKNISNSNLQQEENQEKLIQNENSNNLTINKETEENMDSKNKNISINDFEFTPKKEKNNEKKLENNIESGYIDLDKILNEKNEFSSLNNLNNNNVYVTEANIIGENKNYETPDVRKKTIISTKKSNTTKKTKILDSLTPIIYRKKIDSKVNLNPLQFRLKKMEENLKKQNEYDYERIMKEIDFQNSKRQKEIEHQKEINVKNLKFSEKLKAMESYREKILNDRVQKILDRQKQFNSQKNSLSLDGNYIKTENGHKKSITIDINNTSSQKKLPDISVKYKLIRQMQKENEDNFCFETNERLKYCEEEHKKNHIIYLKKKEDKIQEFFDKYNERNLKCMLTKKDNENERKENYINQDMFKRLKYNELALEKK